MTPEPSWANWTREEEANLATFGTDGSREQYLVYGLTGREERLIRRFCARPGARVMDLGCGYGRTTVPLHEAGFRVLGFDIVPRMIVEARRSHPHIAWALMSATDLALPDESVDYALFSANGIDCIHPLRRREDALREVRRVLRPGGCLVYSSHNWLAAWVTSAWHSTRRRELWRNVRGGRMLPGPFRVRQAGGDLVLYYGTLWSERRRLARLGFCRISVHGGKISPRLDWGREITTALFDASPYYVAYR